MQKILIGIDPDTEKSGFAFKLENTFYLKNLSFFDLLSELIKISKFYPKEDYKIEVFIECGFLNSGSRHSVKGGSIALNSKIGERIGANHEVCKKICEMCEFLSLNFHQIRPTKTKVKHDFFKKLTGTKNQTNQEQRDAFMLIHGR